METALVKIDLQHRWWSVNVVSQVPRCFFAKCHGRWRGGDWACVWLVFCHVCLWECMVVCWLRICSEKQAANIQLKHRMVRVKGITVQSGNILWIMQLGSGFFPRTKIMNKQRQCADPFSSQSPTASSYTCWQPYQVEILHHIKDSLLAILKGVLWFCPLSKSVLL